MGNEELTLLPTGGGSLRPPLAEITIAPKRIHRLIQNFLTFHKCQKRRFRKNLNLKFLPHPPLEGGTKNMKFSKIGHRA